jgi:hypothetical protein
MAAKLTRLTHKIAIQLHLVAEVKVNFYLCFFNWAPCHEGVLEEWRYSFTHSLTSAIVGGEWSASRPGRFTPREIALGNHWIGGWVGPRAILDAVVKRKIPSSRRESSPRIPIVQHVAQRYHGSLVADSCIICSCRSRQPVRKLLDTPS